MNERIKALRGRLPNGVLGIISKYDCHPTADLMKTVKMKSWEQQSVIPAGMSLTVQEPAYFLPPYDWLDRRTELSFYFRRWCYDTLPEMGTGSWRSSWRHAWPPALTARVEVISLHGCSLMASTFLQVEGR